MRDDLFALLERAVADGVFPGCVALVSREGATVYHEAHGTLSDHPGFPMRGEPVTRSTVYDLASLTKVLATTSLCALAVADGALELDAPVPEPWSAACPGATLTDLLEHCSGLTAHIEFFTAVKPFDADAVLEHVAASEPEYPLRDKAVYSDLGFMVLGAWLERESGKPLDQLFADRIAFALGLREDDLPELAFRRLFSDALPSGEHERRIAPTEVYERTLHEQEVPSHVPVREHVAYAHGAVHDDNAYVMGGVAGHAGLFGTAQAVHDVAQAWLGPRLPGLGVEVRDRFWQPSVVAGSTRRLGFDGPVWPALGPHAVGHTGYTGTSLWIDPDGDRIFVLLSNRVHPVRTNTAIKGFRARFHEVAMAL